MAIESVEVTPGTGAAIAADNVGGVLYPVGKLDHGADGIASPTSAANPFPVAIIAGQVGVAGGAGVTDALTQRVVHSSNDAIIGGVTETAPASDTASSGLNGRLQRIAQRLTNILALLPTSLGAGGGLKVDGSGTALPVAIASGSVTIVTGSATASLSNQTDQASTAVLAAASSSRKGFWIENDSTVDLYVAFASTASTTAYTKKLTSGQGWGAQGVGIYQGDIAGIWASDASGSARVTKW